MKKVATTLIIISTVFLGFGFIGKNQHLPGASIAFILGSTLSIFAMILYFIARYQNKNDVKIATYSVYFYFFTMCLGTSFMVNNGSKDLLNAFLIIEQNISLSNTQILNNLKNIKKTNDTQELSQITEELYTFIEDQKNVMISITGGLDEQHSPYGKSNQDVAAIHFLIEDGGFYGKELIRLLQEHQSIAFNLLQNNSDLLRKIEFDVFPNQNNSSLENTWVSNIVEDLPLSSVNTNLTLFQNQALQNTLTVLTHLDK